MDHKIKRSTILRAMKKSRPRATRAAVPCRGCAEPMWVAPGEDAKYHAACRLRRSSRMRLKLYLHEKNVEGKHKPARKTNA